MDDVTFAKAFALELEAEVPASRKCLERIPEKLFNWKPHPKSMEMGYLSLLVAEIPLWITHTIKNADIDFATFQHFKPQTTQELVGHFDKNVADAKNTLLLVKDGGLNEVFELKGNGKVMYSTTKRKSLESMINHLVHHRGQLTVYMRLNEIAVPSIYGPSADEKGF
jgi:uncharacterized damage-inducible protein DinB